jgi:hypothetical protein
MLSATAALNIIVAQLHQAHVPYPDPASAHSPFLKSRLRRAAKTRCPVFTAT